jgi:hypothetical protein
MNPSFLEIFVKGKEKARFIRREGGKNKRDVVYYVSKKIIEFRGNCFQFQGPLAPGDYTIPFEFCLPKNIPASICYQSRPPHSIEGKHWATIKYSIQAILNTHEK